MISLSRAIRQSRLPDPLEAACAALQGNFRMASPESACDMRLHALYTAWPQIGESIRSWPALARTAEGLTPPLVEKWAGSGGFTKRKANASLYRLITALHDVHQWPNAKIADLLEASRL